MRRKNRFLKDLIELNNNLLLSSGINLVYDRAGPADGPTILLLHAGGESRRVWGPVIAHLTLQDWQVIAVDQRGHGSSDRADSYLFQDFINDGSELVERLCNRPLVIAGSSIGGLVGLILAGRLQSQVDGLVLLDAPTRLCPDAAQREKQKVSEGMAQGLDVLAHVDPKLASSSLVEDVLSQPQRLAEAASRIRIPTSWTKLRDNRLSRTFPTVASLPWMPVT